MFFLNNKNKKYTRFEVSTAMMLWCHRTSKTPQHENCGRRGDVPSERQETTALSLSITNQKDWFLVFDNIIYVAHLLR